MHYQDTVDKNEKQMQRHTEHTKTRLNKSSYIKMLREDMDDKPEEVSGAMGLTAKTEYMKEMENLEKVELNTFTRMQMTKAQKKYHAKMMKEGNHDRLDQFDELKDIDLLLNHRENPNYQSKQDKK